MKNGPIFFLGLFTAIAISWAGIVLASHAQLGSLAPYFDEARSQAFPQRLSGIAMRGQLVYADLGCAACHTQQVRRPGFGSDQERGWGERQSVARDYIYEPRPQLGSSRFGPDLTNFGARIAQAADPAGAVYNLLYNGAPTHPSYKFLFKHEEIVGQPSNRALQLADENAPARGFQIVPTERAQALVAYLLSLNNDYVYPEARPYVAAAGEAAPASEAAPAAPPPEQHPVTPIPAAAADEKKQEESKK